MEDLLVTPLGWVVVLAAAALPVAMVRRRRRRPVAPALALVFGIALGVVFVGACPLVAGHATRALEKFGRRWPPPPAWAQTAGAAPDVIVVLTGGQRGREGAEPILNGASTDRALAAVAAAGRWPEIPIVITGGANAGATRPTSDLMARLARDLGVPGERLIVESEALDTRENGTKTVPVLARLGARRIALVTSPDHMARARGVFARLGYETLAVPATPITPEVWSWSQLMPDAGALERTTATLHEVIGLAVYRARGWVGAPEGDAASR